MIECGPGDRPGTVNVATPAAFRFAEPSTIVPSSNVIVPVTLPPLPTTVEVRVSGALESDGFRLDISVALVPMTCIVSTSTFDVAAWLFASPLYAATMECCPTASVETVSEAAPTGETDPGPKI